MSEKDARNVGVKTPYKVFYARNAFTRLGNVSGAAVAVYLRMVNDNVNVYATISVPIIFILILNCSIDRKDRQKGEKSAEITEQVYLLLLL